MDRSLHWMTAVELRELIARRQISPVEVVEGCLARIAELDPVLRSFVVVDAERAMAHAKEAEAQVVAGADLGPLHGVPVAVKDDVWAAGVPSAVGSLLFAGFRPSIDGTVVERLRQAGAIVVGRTNMPEFASWPRSKSRLVGESVNPWDTTRIAGASSGGSAAAVAAGMVPLAVGSDGGGSVRIPAALCGVAGLFPTIGRIPAYGSFRYSPEGSCGPIARTVGDVALLQQVLAGPDPRDEAAIPRAAPDVLSGLGDGVDGLRIAWSADFGRIALDPRIIGAAHGAISALQSSGALVAALGERVEHPWGDGSMMAAHQDAVADRRWDEAIGSSEPPPDLTADEPWLREASRSSASLLGMPAFRALCDRHHELLAPHSQLSGKVAMAPNESVPSAADLRSVMARILSDHDVICTPTMATTAPVAPEGWGSPYGGPFMGTDFTFIANTTGCPAATVPCGLVDGLPVGVQIIGRPEDEATVLRVARRIEATLGPLPRPPTHDQPEGASMTEASP